jgi:glycosyltransferase involved in cell wall biosynthesis
MEKKRVYHVYFGTQGSAGLYLDEIYQSLAKLNVNQDVFVSYYYPFNYGNKFFFKNTDLIATKKKKRFRLYVRYIELIWGLFQTLFKIVKNKPHVVNYSLISTFRPEYLFLSIIKKLLNIKLVITCHDVLPFGTTHQSMLNQKKIRKRFFDLADFLLIHNRNSKDDLCDYFQVSETKIICHPFPIMDLCKIYKKSSMISERTIDFLFIGHLREEKGVDLLLNAWKDFHRMYPQASLCIAGNRPENSNINIEEYDGYNVEFRLYFLSDGDYCKLIASARYVILPYLRGTNSGVVSTVLSMGTGLIASDISMFRNNPLINRENLFSIYSKKSLLKIMSEKMSRDDTVIIRLDDYRSKFQIELEDAYRKVLRL